MTLSCHSNRFRHMILNKIQSRVGCPNLSRYAFLTTKTSIDQRPAIPIPFQIRGRPLQNCKANPLIGLIIVRSRSSTSVLSVQLRSKSKHDIIISADSKMCAYMEASLPFVFSSSGCRKQRSHSCHHHNSGGQNSKEKGNDNKQHNEYSPHRPTAQNNSCLLLTLFLIYCFLEDKFNEMLYPRVTVATCNSQCDEGITPNYVNQKMNAKPSEDQRSSRSSTSRPTVSDESKSRISPEIYHRVDETSSISLEQAVEKADDLLEKRKLELGSPGIVVCASVDGKYVYSKGLGYADVENQVDMHPHSVLRIASISKSMTAAIVAKLSEEGKLNLDQSVYHYVPNFPQKDFLGEKCDLTVRQLLNHTSGIRHYWYRNDPILPFQPKIDEMVSLFDRGICNLFYSNLKVTSLESKHHAKPGQGEKMETKCSPVSRSLRDEYYSSKHYATTDESLKMFSKDRLAAKPGTKYIYSTFAYSLLAAVVEAVSKQPFADVAKDSFQAWGMRETYLDKHGPIIHHRARPYEKKNGILVNTPYIDASYKWAGGGFLSTVMDVVKFGNLMLYSYQHLDTGPSPKGFLKKSTVDEMWTPVVQKVNGRKYGLGFELIPAKESYGMCPNRTLLAGHTGAAVGASSVVVILPRSPSQISEDKVSENMPASFKRESQGSLPQGVVVAVFVNLVGVSLMEVAEEIARTFERVVFD